MVMIDQHRSRRSAVGVKPLDNGIVYGQRKARFRASPNIGLVDFGNQIDLTPILVPT